MSETASPNRRPIGVLVLGLGNVLLGDDGLGGAAIARLEARFATPSGVRLADGGTLGLALLGLFADAEHVVIVDAIRAEAAPGSPIRLAGEDVAAAVRDRLSPHQVGVADLLDAARLIDRYPDSVTLLGLVPDSLDLRVGRSTAVEAGLGKLVDCIAAEVRRLGYPMLPRPVEATDHAAAADFARYFGM